MVLYWDTFTDAANQAGISRRYGGIHFKAGDLTGRAVGKVVGFQAWQKAVELWEDREDHQPEVQHIFNLPEVRMLEKAVKDRLAKQQTP